MKSAGSLEVRTGGRWSVLAASAMLAGCAGTPPVAVQTFGALPPPGSARMLVDGNVPQPLGGALNAGLAAQGFPASDQGQYLVQVTASDLPGRAGLFTPTEGGQSSGEWLLAPTRSRSTVQRVIVVAFSDRATGRSLYRIVASEPRKAGKSVPDERIAEAVASKLAAPHQTLGE